MADQTLNSLHGKASVDIPGLLDDPFIQSEIEDLRLLALGTVTALYRFRMNGRCYVVKTLTSVHHTHTLESIREKRTVLERLGFPRVHSINEVHNFYIMEYLNGQSVFQKVIRGGRRRHFRRQRDCATLTLLATVAGIHAEGWLLNDLSWRNFMFTAAGVRPVDLDRIRTFPEEARYIAGLGGKASYTTPLFLSVAQCLNSVPSKEDEMQGVALMIDSIYNGDYLVGDYLKAEGLDYSRRNQALMLVSGFYPRKRQSHLPRPLCEPIRRILAKHDRTVTAQELLEVFRQSSP